MKFKQGAGKRRGIEVAMTLSEPDIAFSEVRLHCLLVAALPDWQSCAISFVENNSEWHGFILDKIVSHKSILSLKSLSVACNECLTLLPPTTVSLPTNHTAAGTHCL